MKKIMLALVVVGAAIGTAHAAPIGGDPCILINSMQGVFKTLRTLAFVGAAFCIAGWAWGYISNGGEKAMDSLKKQGVGLIIGFSLLFSIGLIMNFLPGLAGCAAIGWN